VIRVESLTKTFDRVRAVDGVSFHVRPGEIFAFLGPNGAGKTTTIQMLTTLTRPSSGTILIDGLDPATHGLEVRRRFGIVFQDQSVDVELTAYENMDLYGVLYHVPRTVRPGRIEALLKIFGLWERRKDLVRTFSGGMRRRLEVARGFLHTPKILFLDEPTIGLDPQSRKQLWTHVKRMNEAEGVTVFFTTHYMDQVEHVARRIAIINHGRIVAQGDPQTIKMQHGADSLEQAFLALTGTAVRDEHADSAGQMQQVVRMWQRRRQG
jgi:ABC-2 type transport system ATP-binding protein